jgi:hypothetical protein
MKRKLDKDQCLHIWCLDHEIYFNTNTHVTFPAVCPHCIDPITHDNTKRKFTRQEWLEYIGGQYAS